MTPKRKLNQDKIREQAGTLLKPGNLLKTVASQFPIASLATDLIDQIEQEETAQGLESLEGEVASLAELRTLEQSVVQAPPPLSDWSIPVGEFLKRTVSIAVIYDGGFHSAKDRGREFTQPIAHGCIIGPKEVLTCREALEFARDVAETKYGRLVVLVGMATYEFEAEAPDKMSGLCICYLSKLDEKKWERYASTWKKRGLGEVVHKLIQTPVRGTVTPWMGQEVGFIHAGEAKDVIRVSDEMFKLQFDHSTISHFRFPKDDSFKSFVTGVLPGRVLQVGAAVFSRDGTLLGFISDTESYSSDAGRRAVVRSLLGHPRFTRFKKNENETVQK